MFGLIVILCAQSNLIPSPEYQIVLMGEERPRGSRPPYRRYADGCDNNLTLTLSNGQLHIAIFTLDETDGNRTIAQCSIPNPANIYLKSDVFSRSLIELERALEVAFLSAMCDTPDVGFVRGSFYEYRKLNGLLVTCQVAWVSGKLVWMNSPVVI